MTTRTLVLLFAASLSATAWSVTSSASAQPMDTYGMSSRSVAMAGAVTADVEDFSANYYNPAGLARGNAVRLGVGYFGALHDLSIDGLNSNVDPLRGLVGGLVVPGAIDDFHFAFGVGVHLNDDYVSRTRTLPSRRPRWEFYDNRPRRTFLAAHVAIRPVSWLSIGGGIAFLSYSASSLTARGTLDIASPDRNSHLESELRADLTTIRYPQVGVQIQASPELSFGLVYRGQFALDNTLQARIGCDGTDPNCDLGLSFTGLGDPFNGYLDLRSQSVNAFVPMQVSFGTSWQPTRDFRLNVEVTWVNWSSYQSPVGSSTIVLQIDVPEALRDRIFVPDGIVGSTPVPANFSDRLIPRVGAEGVVFRDRAVELRGRGGWFFEASPAPDQTGATNLVDTDRWSFSAGAGLRLHDLRPLLPGFVQIDAHVQYSFLPERSFQKTSLVDPVGDYRAGGQVFAGGLTLEVGFE